MDLFHKQKIFQESLKVLFNCLKVFQNLIDEWPKSARRLLGSLRETTPQCKLAGLYLMFSSYGIMSIASPRCIRSKRKAYLKARRTSAGRDFRSVACAFCSAES